MVIEAAAEKLNQSRQKPSILNTVKNSLNEFMIKHEKSTLTNKQMRSVRGGDDPPSGDPGQIPDPIIVKPK